MVGQDYLANVKSTHESGECATGGPQVWPLPCMLGFLTYAGWAGCGMMPLEW